MTDSKTPKLPEVTVNKNGYCIRADLIDFAKDWVKYEYEHKIGRWQTKASISNGKFVYDAEYPEIPGIDKVVEAAEKFYQFVLKNSK